ncbi:MAG: hypothetical protein KIS92_03175 [Planctomycetota bacterium]|nr:hypothetical protein [Planctomycetota bacterium]
MQREHLRNLTGITTGYNTINREERNLAALLYAALLKSGNLAAFLLEAESSLPVVDGEIGVYYEYAFLRDLWSRKLHDNEGKRNAVLRLLRPSNTATLERCSVGEFNEHFGAVPKPSEGYIQSPGTWSIGRFTGKVPDKEELRRTCIFKWSFNAKPDIVIHTSHETALVIEAKLESGEGSYPNSASEIALFKDRGLELVRQTEVQKYLMEELLGLRCEYLFLTQDGETAPDGYKPMSWTRAFGAVDTSDTLPFVSEWLRRVSGPGDS